MGLADITVSNPAGVWMSVSCLCCVLSGRGLYVRLITSPEESYRVWCVLSVIVKPRLWGGPGPLEGGGAVAPRRKIIKRVSHLKSEMKPSTEKSPLKLTCYKIENEFIKVLFIHQLMH